MGRLRMRPIRARRIVDRQPTAETRDVIRSAKNPSPGRGTKCRLSAQTTPTLCGTAVTISLSVPLRGIQNSSASVLITQSAPCSVAASRAMCVRQSASRTGPATGILSRCPARTYDSRISVVPSSDS